MSACRDISREMLPEFVLGTLDPEEMILVGEHLEMCRDCASEEAVLRELEKETVPEPDPWFYAGLAKKVIAQGRDHRMRKRRILVPVWAGSAAAAAVALMLVMPGFFPSPPGEMTEYAAMGPAGASFLGLEADVLLASKWALDDLETQLLADLEPVSEEFIAAADMVPGAAGYELLDDMTIQVFEGLVEEMTRKRVRKRVTS